MSEVLSVTTIAALLNATAGLIDDATALIRMSEDPVVWTDDRMQDALSNLAEAIERASNNGHILHEECEAVERERTGEHRIVQDGDRP